MCKTFQCQSFHLADKISCLDAFTPEGSLRKNVMCFCRWLEQVTSALQCTSVVLCTHFHIHSVNGPCWQGCRFSEAPTAVRWHYAISWAKLCWDTVLFITATAASCSVCFWVHIKIQTFPFGLRMVFVWAWCYTRSLGVQTSTSKVFVHEKPCWCFGPWN